MVLGRNQSFFFSDTGLHIHLPSMGTVGAKPVDFFTEEHFHRLTVVSFFYYIATVEKMLALFFERGRKKRLRTREKHSRTY